MFAAHKKLDNLCVIVDNNNLQIDGTVEEVNSPYPIPEKFEAFGFHVEQIDGHDFDQIERAFEAAKACKDKPCLLYTSASLLGLEEASLLGFDDVLSLLSPLAASSSAALILMMLSKSSLVIPVFSNSARYLFSRSRYSWIASSSSGLLELSTSLNSMIL